MEIVPASAADGGNGLKEIRPVSCASSATLGPPFSARHENGAGTSSPSCPLGGGIAPASTLASSSVWTAPPQRKADQRGRMNIDGEWVSEIKEIRAPEDSNRSMLDTKKSACFCEESGIRTGIAEYGCSCTSDPTVKYDEDYAAGAGVVGVGLGEAFGNSGKTGYKSPGTLCQIKSMYECSTYSVMEYMNDYGERFAGKLYLREFAANPYAHFEFLRELELHENLSGCPTIARLLGRTEFMADGGKSYGLLLMEPAETTLAARMASGCISSSDALTWAADIAEALVCMHWRNGDVLVHRDIRPENVMITKYGKAKLFNFAMTAGSSMGASGDLDFEDAWTLRLSALRANDLPLPEAQSISRYLGGEVFRKRCYNQSLDIYALGIILWEMLSNDRAYSKAKLSPSQVLIWTTTHALRPTIPNTWHPELVEIVQQCWHADPAKRPTASALHARLCRLVTAEHSGTFIPTKTRLSGRLGGLLRNLSLKGRKDLPSPGGTMSSISSSPSSSLSSPSPTVHGNMLALSAASQKGAQS